MDKKQCRIIIDHRCCYSCSYCCNKLEGMMDRFVSIKREDVENVIQKYESVCLTGGEPLMPSNLYKTTFYAEKVKWYRKNLYVYTNLQYYPSPHLISMVDGWSIGFHPSQVKVEDFIMKVQRMIALGARSIRVMAESGREDVLSELNEMVTIKLWEMNKCDKTDVEDWFKITEE